MSRMNEDFESVLVCFYTKILLSLLSFFFFKLRTSFLSACNLLICDRKIIINVRWTLQRFCSVNVG